MKEILLSNLTQMWGDHIISQGNKAKKMFGVCVGVCVCMGEGV